MQDVWRKWTPRDKNYLTHFRLSLSEMLRLKLTKIGQI